MEEQRYPKVKGKVCRSLMYSVKHLASVTKQTIPEDEKGTHIFVKGFAKFKWNHQEFHNAFKKFGKIVSCKVSLDKNHNSKGYGYVQFEDQKSAREAIQEVSYSG